MREWDQTILGLLIIGALVIIVLWIVLPFAVFGIKGHLRELVHLQQRTNELLQQQLDRTKGRD